jgi:hypothetical protein
MNGEIEHERNKYRQFWRHTERQFEDLARERNEAIACWRADLESLVYEKRALCNHMESLVSETRAMVSEIRALAMQVMRKEEIMKKESALPNTTSSVDWMQPADLTLADSRERWVRFFIAAISGLAASLDHRADGEHKRDAEDVAYDAACIADAALVEYDERLPTAP